MKSPASSQPKVIVIGIGNAYRSDDAVGLIAARLLRERLPGYCSVFEHAGEGTSLMDLWAGADCVILIDATRTAAAPGTIRRFDVTHRPLPAATFRDSTHAFSLVEAIELSRALNQLPNELFVYGVEGQDFQAGTNLSPAMDLAIRNVVENVLREVNDSQSRYESINAVKR
jgi:hydrogenase maturation protease